jgi:integrase
MTSYNAANERMKRQYFAYLAEAQGHSEQTIDAVAKAISRFEAYARYKDFKAFHIEQAKAFKRELADQRGHRSGEPLSKATLYATLNALKRFFIWLAGQPGYKSRISYSDAEYFNLSAKETRIAKATRPARIPTLEQIRHVIHAMPASTEIERRDRALIAFTILTGARDGAIASFKLGHIDIAEGKIDQDAREVRTKFSKSFVTTFFPVGDDIRAVVANLGGASSSLGRVGISWFSHRRFAAKTASSMRRSRPLRARFSWATLRSPAFSTTTPICRLCSGRAQAT